MRFIEVCGLERIVDEEIVLGRIVIDGYQGFEDAAVALYFEISFQESSLYLILTF